MKDEIIDFIEDHKILCIIAVVVAILLIAMFAIRSSNLKKKAAEEETALLAAEAETEVTLEQDTEEEVQPTNEYLNSLGLDSDRSDGRVTVEETEEPEPVEVTPVQTTPTYDTVVTIFDHTSVPTRNMDGSSCSTYYNSVKLSDFGTYWGESLTDDDFFGGNFYMVGVEQNPDDTLKGDLQSLGWLINHISDMNANDAIKFTNLHVIGSLSDTHVALLCSYDWYSAYGMDDTLVVFEDISGTLDTKDFDDGDIFSAIVFVHNIKVLESVRGQRVVVVEYNIFD